MPLKKVKQQHSFRIEKQTSLDIGNKKDPSDFKKIRNKPQSQKKLDVYKQRKESHQTFISAVSHGDASILKVKP